MTLRLPRSSPHRYGALALAVLAGCASPTHRPSADQAQIQQFAAKGYLSEEQYSIRTTPQTWEVAGHAVDVMLSVPVRPGRYPLVIYLPGLGENRSAGEVWRNAWSQAGYAVLSVQPLSVDSTAWRSKDARNGDFKPLVRERHSAAVMERRQEVLRALLAEVKKRGRDGDELLANVDSENVALAGFDLGAYGALVAAGERTGTGKAGKRVAPLSAVIALSPYADFNGPTFEQRYADIKLPVLSITGDGDEDPYGLGIPAHLRSAPFQYMPPRDKFLLSLDSANHELFAGNARSSERGEQEVAAEQEPSPSGRRRRGSGNGEGQPARHSEIQIGGRMNGTALAMGQSAVVSVTTAFLDAYLKGDAISREWLARDARRWLRNTGTLTVK